jgi:hypothetical protein
MDSAPIATMPTSGASPICTAADPQGKQSWVMSDGTVVSNGKVVSNGTPGQVVSTAVPKTDQQKWQDQHKVACQKDWLSWMANCSQDGAGVNGGSPDLPIGVSKVYAGASAGGVDGSVSYGTDGLQTDYSVPVAPGSPVSGGTKGVTTTVSADDKMVPKGYIGLCVQIGGKREAKPGPKVETAVSGGFFGGSANNEGEVCVQVQTLAPPEGSFSAKPF